MWYRLKRHPFPVAAHFRRCLALTYALPASAVEPLLPPGLTLDTYRDFGFVAVALVQTEGLRPAFLPAALGQSFFLIGYRIFVRHRTRAGKNLRGLRILRSDTDSPMLATLGNLFTHYGYRRVSASVRDDGTALEIEVCHHGKLELHVTADLRGDTPVLLPVGSPFRDPGEARRYAGPMPFTFDYERETHSILRVQGVRPSWNPRLVPVSVPVNRFFDRAPFDGHEAILASAFFLSDIDYRWEPGICEPLPAVAAA